MLIGIIMTPRDEVTKNPKLLGEAALKVSDALKNLPSSVAVKNRYVFGAGDNVKAIIVLDADRYEQLMPFLMDLPEYFNLNSYPVIDNTEEVVQQAVR